MRTQSVIIPAGSSRALRTATVVLLLAFSMSANRLLVKAANQGHARTPYNFIGVTLLVLARAHSCTRTRVGVCVRTPPTTLPRVLAAPRSAPFAVTRSPAVRVFVRVLPP